MRSGLLDSGVESMYSKSMNRLRLLPLGLISVLLIILVAISLFLDTKPNPAALRTPIPAETLAAFQPGEPITNPTQAFVAAQFYLGTTRLQAAGDILPYSAELIRFTEAHARTGEFVDMNAYRVPLPQNLRVWLVLLEGQWYIDPPVPDAAPSEPAAGCVFVILDTRTNDLMSAGGIRPCSHYQVRYARQIIQDFLLAKGISARPGTRAYGVLMKGILLGEYPELTGPQPRLVRNQAELDSVLAYAGQHMQDGTWRFWEQPREPDIPEALLPAGTPIPIESYPPVPFWADTPEALPPTETPRPTQSYPPQPIWFSPVITVPLPIPSSQVILGGEWLSATRLQVTIQSPPSGSLYWIDLGAGDPLVSTAQPVSAGQQAYSASHLYSVQCGNPLQMLEAASQTVISQADLAFDPNAMTNCSSYVSWSGDEVAAFAARSEGAWSTYLWRPDGSAPFRVGPALIGSRPPAWSPEGDQLAFVNYTTSEPRTLQMMVVSQDGRLLQRAPIDLILPLTGIRWPGQQVLALRDEYKLWQYYEAETGELLFTWQEALSMGSTLHHQYPSPSPDGRWFTIDRGGIDSSGIFHKTYYVYDLQSRQEVLLYDRPWHLMEFSGWSPDGETLYLLHLPAGPEVADPDLPYGLLAYHPLGGDFELLVENAQAVYWDANYQKALVSVFVQDSAGQSTLIAGIWDQSTHQVAGTALITNSPTRYDFLLHPYSMIRMIPAAWSPAGDQVVLFNWQGDLLLMGLDGQTQLLASQVGLGRSDFTRLLAWSPDGSRLFVSDRGTVWILTIE